MEQLSESPSADALLDALSGAVYVFDESGVVAEVVSAADATGFPVEAPTEVCGVDLSTFLGTDTAGRIVESVERVLETGESERLEYGLSAGSRSGIELWLDPLEDGRVLGTARETEPDTGQDDTIDALDRLTRLGKSDRQTLSGRLERALEIGCERLDLSIGYLTRIEDGTMHVREAVGDHPDIQSGESVRLSETYCRKAIESDGLLGVFDAPAEGWTDDPAYRRFGLGCYLGGKLVVDGECYGTICFANSSARARAFTEAETTFVALLCEWATLQLERRQHERAFEQERSFAEQSLDAVMEVFYALDMEGNLERWNERARAVIGYTDEELADMHALDCFPPDERERVAGAIEEVLATGSTTIETRLLTSDGEEIPYEFTGARLTDEAGELRGLVGFGRDISERKERERELERTESLFERTQRLADIGAWELDVDTERFHWTDHVSRLCGMSPEYDPTPDEAFEFVHPDDREEIEAAFDRVLEEGRTIEHQARIVTADDEQRRVTIRAEPRLEDGEVKRVRGTIRDVTERERLFDRLRQQRRTIETIAENVPIAIFAYDQDGVFTHSEGRALEQLGLESGEAVGESLFELFGDQPTIPEQARRVLDGASVHDVIEVADATFEVWHEPVEEDGEIRGAVGLAMDVTDRERRKRELETYETAIDTAADMIYQLDADGRFVMANDAAVTELGYERSELLGEDVATILTAESHETGRETIGELVRDDSRTVIDEEFELLTADEDMLPVECRITPLYSKDGEFRGTIGVARDVSERKEHRETLTALHQVTNHLLRAETAEEIGERVVNAVERLFEFEGVGFYLFDDEESTLEPLACSDRTRELIGSLPNFHPGEGLAWDVFVDGEPRVYDDVTSDGQVYNPDTPFRSEVILPLGERGVLIASKTTAGTPEEKRLELIEILAANCEAALARTRREQELRDREAKLQQRNDRLEFLTELDEQIRRINQALVGAETDSEIKRVVCNRLADSDRFAFACIGRIDPVEEFVPDAWAGDERGYLDSISPTLSGDEPVARAARERELTVVEDVADRLHEADWRKEAISCEYRSAAAVPLIYDDVRYGVLSVYATEARTFDELLRDTLRELGATIAHALNAAECKQALLSDEQVELEFTLPTDASTLFKLVDERDCRVSVDSILPQSGEKSLVYAMVSDVDPETIEAAAADLVTVDRARTIGQVDGDVRIELGLQGETIAETVAEHGGLLEELAIEDGTGCVVITLPETANSRSFIEMFQQKYPEATLFAHRQTSAKPADGRSTSPFDRLTQRQTDAIMAAYYSGFFEWPRDCAGEEIADSLGISPPTFREHLRHAEAKLLGHVLERNRSRE